MRRHLALILGLLALCRAPSASAAKSEGVWVYTVKSGDTCWSIAQRFLGSGDQNARIHKLNRLGPMPHILSPGQQLRLPGSAPVADATIEWLRRDARTKPPTSPEWRRAEIRQELWRLYKVATGDGSSAGIIFEDTSFLRLRESALLVIYGGSREKTKNRRLEKREIVVEKGIVRGGLAALYHNKRQPGDRLTLRTPSATVILRSPSSQVEVDEKKMSIVSVYRGNATVRAKGKEVDVPREFGTRVELGKRPEKPRPLPPPPRWSFTPYERVALVPKGGLGTVEAHWTAVPRAARYRVELARTPSFRQPMIDAVVGAGVRRFRATKLKPGVYYARVATIGSGKLEGKPSKRLKIHVIALASVPPLVPTTSGELVAPAFLRLSPPPRSSGVQLSVDGAAFRPFVDALRLRRPGTYRLRFRRLGSSWPVPELRIVILGVKAALEIRRTQLVPGQQAVFE
ncbi:MAG: LysM peptidoglycan-binding domain-containing protein, partial [Myxococcales bacterium]|nr:LysM peptidoglycan-binding domain-containing protein [Myxococcales bacterium]